MSYKTLSTLYPYMCRCGPETAKNDDVFTNDDIQTMFTTTYEEANVNFDNSNGTFTAQVRGVYYFDLMLQCRNQSDSDGSILKFGYDIYKGTSSVEKRETFASPESTTTGQASQFGLKTIVTLDVGDRVQLRVYQEGGGAQDYAAKTSYYNVFLISAFT